MKAIIIDHSKGIKKLIYQTILQYFQFPIPEADLEKNQGARSPFFFGNHLFFCDHFEELHAVFMEVNFIINYVPLTYIYPNTTKTYLTPNLVLFADSYYVVLTQHQL